jgi:hypothetical protein
MTAPTIHCVNVIHPRRSGARTHSVSLKLVLAISEKEALRRVAAESDDGDLIRYRNAFEPAEVLTWSWQSWTRDDVASSSARPARALSPVTERDRARFWEDVVPYFGLDTSFDYEATPEVLLGYLKAYDRAEAI